MLDPDQAGYRSYQAAGRVLGVLHMRHLNGDAWAVQRLQELLAAAPPGQTAPEEIKAERGAP